MSFSVCDVMDLLVITGRKWNWLSDPQWDWSDHVQFGDAGQSVWPSHLPFNLHQVTGTSHLWYTLSVLPVLSVLFLTLFSPQFRGIKLVVTVLSRCCNSSTDSEVLPCLSYPVYSTMVHNGPTNKEDRKWMEIWSAAPSSALIEKTNFHSASLLKKLKIKHL